MCYCTMESGRTVLDIPRNWGMVKGGYIATLKCFNPHVWERISEDGGTGNARGPNVIG